MTLTPWTTTDWASVPVNVSPTLLFLALSVCPTRTTKGVPEGTVYTFGGGGGAAGAGAAAEARAGEERVPAPRQEARARAASRELGPGLEEEQLGVGGWLGVRGPVPYCIRPGVAGRPRRTSASSAVDWDALNTACLFIIFSLN